MLGPQALALMEQQTPGPEAVESKVGRGLTSMLEVVMAGGAALTRPPSPLLPAAEGVDTWTSSFLHPQVRTPIR